MVKMNAAKKCLNCNLDGTSDCPGNCADYPEMSKLTDTLVLIFAVILWVHFLIICGILIVIEWLSRVIARRE